MTTPPPPPPAQVTEPEDRVILSPSDRYSLVGKTGCGKTTLTCVIAQVVVPPALAQADWQVWWIDTKGDPRDIARLQKLGYVEGDPATGLPKVKRPFWRRDELPPSHLYFRLRTGPVDVVDLAQHMFRLALNRRRVLVIVDEYTQVIVSPRRAGRDLDDIERTGRGIGVGLLGNTQEPVDIPRQLLSQATQLFIMDLSFPTDIKYMRQFVDDYDRPPRTERHAFTHVWLDGDSVPRYYPNLRAWRSRVVDEGTA